MTNSPVENLDRPTESKLDKRTRLAIAATQMLHERGVEKTTIADIAKVANVALGNVYYHFKTKDQLVEAAIDSHARHLQEMIGSLEPLRTPQERLKGLVGGWIAQGEVAARYGCPFGTLSSELDKRDEGDDGLDRTAAKVMRLLVDWSEVQFGEMGRRDSRDLAISLIASYQGISLLTNTFRDPQIMTDQGRRLESWIDSLEPSKETES